MRDPNLVNRCEVRVEAWEKVKKLKKWVNSGTEEEVTTGVGGKLKGQARLNTCDLMFPESDVLSHAVWWRTMWILTPKKTKFWLFDHKRSQTKAEDTSGKQAKYFVFCYTNICNHIRTAHTHINRHIHTVIHHIHRQKQYFRGFRAMEDDRATELNWTELKILLRKLKSKYPISEGMVRGNKLQEYGIVTLMCQLDWCPN